MKKFLLFTVVYMLFSVVLSVTAQTGETYYVKSRSARVRAEPTTSAAIVATLRSRTPIVVLEVVDGTRVSGSTTWYRLEVNGEEGYVHSSLVTDTAPAAPVTSSGGGGTSGGSGGQTTPNPQSTPPPLVEQPVQPPAGVSCNGATTCSQMASCEQARACLAAGRSSLDRDHDGIPCESICGG